jgi:hypothetical protein
MDSPHIPSPMEEAKAQMMIDTERNRMEQEKADREKALADAEKQKRVTEATNKRNAAYSSASTYDDRQAAYQGYNQDLLDKYNVSNIYQDEIDRLNAGYSGEDIANFGESNAYNNAVQTGTKTYRQDLNEAINAYAGTDFANNLFGSTKDDPILDAILGTQFDDTIAQIEAAHDRGALNDVGYAKAMERVNNDKTIGRSTLEGIGGGVLGGYRQGLDTEATNIRNAANAATFDNPYDTAAGQKHINDLTTQYGSTLEGDVRKAVGDQQFFDPAAILGYGTTRQGFYNPSKTAGTEGDNALLSTFTDQNKKDPLTAGGGSTF